MQRITVLLAAMLIASCSVQNPPPPDAVTVRATPTSSASGMTARGESQLDVRSFAADGGETSGATCRAETSQSTAVITSPGRILLPYYGEASPPVSVTCTQGGLSGSTVVAIAPARRNGGVAWPSVGVSVNSSGGVGLGMGVGYYGGRSGTEFGSYGYPPANVLLR
jgi:hypothetical protein